MPLMQIPTLVTLPTQGGNARDYSVSFSYDFGPDTAVAQNVMGVNAKGSKYTLDVSSLPIPTAQSLPPFQTLQFSQEYAVYNNTSSAAPAMAGDLFAVVRATSQAHRFTASPYVQSIDQTNVWVVAGIVPLLSGVPTVMDFIKLTDGAAGPNSNYMFGKLLVTLTTRKLPGYIQAGYSASLTNY